MPLYDVRCKAGHTTEVFVRGASAPLTCKECGGEAEKVPSLFTSVIAAVHTEPAKQAEPNQRAKPKYIERMGGGVAYKNELGNYRPALTHTAKCPKENRRRNVAVLGEVEYGVRVNCEVCGWQWIHQAATASDPLIEGYDATLAKGKTFSSLVNNGDQYQTAERGA